MKADLKILVVMGGMSTEREVSLVTGSAVLNALQEAGCCATGYDMTHDVSAFVCVLEQSKPDVVFNALHGRYGEDGCLPGLLDMMQIPYTHSGVLASSVGMNKALTRQLASLWGVSVANGRLMSRDEILSGETFPYPYVIKPNDEGSACGVHIIRSAADKAAAAPDMTRPVYLVEEYIPGRELSCGVLDKGPLGVVEIVPKDGFYDYKNKYTEGGAQHLIPAPIPQDVYDLAMQQAYLVHKNLGCRGTSRSDFRYDPATNRLVFLEINTHPGLTPLSLLPDLAKAAGMSFWDVLTYLLEEASCAA